MQLAGLPLTDIPSFFEKIDRDTRDLSTQGTRKSGDGAVENCLCCDERPTLGQAIDPIRCVHVYKARARRA